MARPATLSYKEHFEWGLRVNPTFDEVFQSTKKPLRIPQPDRSAKWFALSNYRAFMLDAARRYHDFEHLKLDYDESGAHLPQRAAMTGPSADGEAAVWQNLEERRQQLEEHEAHETAMATLEAERRREAAHTRAQHLAASHIPATNHWHIDANHDAFEEAGVEHEIPIQRPQLTRTRLPAPVELPAAVGQIGLLRPLPTFDFLNSGQPRTFREARLGNILEAGSASSNYDRMRNNALGR